jgi:hypothetical protein
MKINSYLVALYLGLVSFCVGADAADELPVLTGITPTSKKAYVYLTLKDGSTVRASENDVVGGFRVLNVDVKSDSVELEKSAKRYLLRLNQTVIENAPDILKSERAQRIRIQINRDQYNNEAERVALENNLRLRALKVADDFLENYDSYFSNETEEEKMKSMHNYKTGNFTYSAPNVSGGKALIDPNSLPPSLADIKASDLAKINQAIEDAIKLTPPKNGKK